MTFLYSVITLVILQRLIELLLANRNTRRLKDLGGIEIGAAHYPLFIILHASWLIAIVCTTPKDASANVFLLILLIVLQLGRIWVIASLGGFWTTRIITLPGAPLVRKGPYRFCDHPNYLIVVGEIAVLPLVFGNWPVALIWSLLNAAMLKWRIRIEDACLGERRI